MSHNEKQALYGTEKQNAVACRARYGKQAFSAMLNGRKIIKVSDIKAIAEALDVLPNELFKSNMQGRNQGGPENERGERMLFFPILFLFMALASLGISVYRCKKVLQCEYEEDYYKGVIVALIGQCGSVITLGLIYAWLLGLLH